MRIHRSTKYWLVSIITLTACFPALALAAIHVDLGVSGDALFVASNDSRCEDARIDCIAVKKGDEPDLFFDLDKACKSGGPSYKLSQIRIAMASKRWPSPDNPLPANVAADFSADPNTGIIDLSAGNNQLKDDRIKLKDKNSGAYTVYYEIQATSCEGSGAIVLDPAIRNTGK